MGYQDAVQDNIRIVKGKNMSPTLFFPLCNNCGKEVLSFHYSRNLKYLCKNCRTVNNIKDKQKRIANDEEIKEKKFGKAVKRIELVAKDFSKYEKAIKEVHNILHIDGYFQSTEEIMTAIELAKNKIAFRHQVKLGLYRADFMLDDMKVVLEIDGTAFHNRETHLRENVRDNLICFSLGAEWEVIRITDKLINENITQLKRAIKETYAERKKVREKNDGMLPEWYTDRKI